MKIEVLGSGGAITTPRPLCHCPICRQAREQGVPYSRMGPSLFIHGPNVVIDTPEEIKQQLNRARIEEVRACFYSHWHPDHVMGRRVWEMHQDWHNWPPQNQCSDLFLPQQVAEDFRHRLGTWEHLAYLAQLGVVRLVEFQDGQHVEIEGVRFFPFRLAQTYVYAFLVEEQDKRALIAPDELLAWTPPPELCGVDLAILPMGILEFDPFTGQRRIPQQHPLLQDEATFLQTLTIVRQLNAKRTVLTHIEESDRISYDDLVVLEQRLQEQGLRVQFAYDTMQIQL